MLGVLPRPPLIVEKIWKAPVVHLPVPPSFLYVSSYCGHVTTLDVRPLTHSQCDNKGPFRLNQVSSTYTGGNPSFLTIDKARSTLYCLDEGLTSTCGSLASFRMNQDGSLALLDKKATPGGPVSGALYHRGKMLAVAH